MAEGSGVVDLVPIYLLRDDAERLHQMQASTTDDATMGLSPEPALIGTPEWWHLVDAEQLEVEEIVGTISEVRWGSMGDWPEFSVVSTTGKKESFTREGDHTRYVEGLKCRVRWVRHPWKVEQGTLGTHCQIVLEIWVENSTRRSDARAPGPGGVGLR
jgi:hypothetical protein